MQKKKLAAIACAVLAALFYAMNMPFSKRLLDYVSPTYMASFLYLGAGIGIGILYFLGNHWKNKDGKLSKEDLPYTLGMIALDILAPILLMIGLTSAASSNASLINNFEIVMTSVIAMLVFKEMISLRLWVAILLITIASLLLSLEDISRFTFSIGSLFVLAAAVCWGFENNCTRKISSKNTFQIVMLKGVFSGLGSFVIARISGEAFPPLRYLFFTLILGFVAYGLSIFLYVRAQQQLGAAKTSAFYAIAPFAGAILSFAILGEKITQSYILALIVMTAGSVLVVADTLLHKTSSESTT